MPSSSPLPREDHGGPWDVPWGTTPEFEVRSYVFRMTGVMVALRKREVWPRKMLTGSGNADRLQEARWLTVAICQNRSEWNLQPCDPNDVRSGLPNLHRGQQRPWQHFDNQPQLQGRRWEHIDGGWYLSLPAHVAALPTGHWVAGSSNRQQPEPETDPARQEEHWQWDHAARNTGGAEDGWREADPDDGMQWAGGGSLWGGRAAA